MIFCLFYVNVNHQLRYFRKTPILSRGSFTFENKTKKCVLSFYIFGWYKYIYIYKHLKCMCTFHTCVDICVNTHMFVLSPPKNRSHVQSETQHNCTLPTPTPAGRGLVKPLATFILWEGTASSCVFITPKTLLALSKC